MWRIRIYLVLTVAAFGILYLFTAIMMIIGTPFLFPGRRKAILFLMQFQARSVFIFIGERLSIDREMNLSKYFEIVVIPGALNVIYNPSVHNFIKQTFKEV
jgi:hypothetical protein